MTDLALVATAALATEDLVSAELTALGAHDVVVGRSVIHFRGNLETAYRACLWSRVASRVLLPFAELEAPDADALYAGVRALPWEDHLGPDDTLAVDFSEHASGVSHTRFGALRVKDAIVDALRERFGRRPDVNVETPRVRVAVRLEGQTASIAIDLSGQSLHRRGYRREGAEAPLRETLAAAVLLRSRWPDAAKAGLPLLDPMCGSGTLVLEAALMALDAAPGLRRTYWGFEGWRGHDRALWERLLEEARVRRKPGYPAPLCGSDHDPEAIARARNNAERAGLGELVRFETREVADVEPPSSTPGHVITNPPYGERLGNVRELGALYATLGDVLKRRFGGWTAHLLTSEEELGRALGLHPERTNKLWNGALAVQLLHCKVKPPRAGARGDAAAGHGEASGQAPRRPRRPGAPIDEALANRLRKNLAKLSRWAKRENVTCHRIYDADLPELAAAVDRYEDRVHVQEYAPPKEIDPEVARRRLASLVATVGEVLELPPDRVFVKSRHRQKEGARYGRLAETGELHEVHEGGHRFLVNLTDRLDTGLFLDSRPIRKLVAELAPGRRFLNLFAYTCTATVYAARGGARSSTSVDLSRNYLDWGARNLRLNGVTGRQHALEQADCLAWLGEARGPYDLILLDPPTFSNSKRMDGTLDIQRDHAELLSAAVRLLAPAGILLFVTNARRFELETDALPADVGLQDISAATIPPDFARNPRIHRCWRMTRGA